MSAENNKVPVMTLTLDGGDSFIVDWQHRADVWATLEYAWEEGVENEDTYAVSFGLMDRAAFEALPEFEGF